MKKKLLFTFVSIVICMAGFVSCSNNDFEECISDTKRSKSLTTRSINDITMEEVKARVNELNEKYNSDVVINEELSAEKFDETFFFILENSLRKDRGLKPLEIIESQVLTNNRIDDSSIDKVSIASTGRSIENVDNNNRVYEEEFEKEENFSAKRFTNFSSFFNRYHYCISYIVQYGRNSAIKFNGFENQTIYSAYNTDDFSLPQSVVDEFAKEHDVTYCDGTLNLTSPVRYNHNDPYNRDEINFYYTYEYKINGTTFEITASHPAGVLSRHTVTK